MKASTYLEAKIKHMLTPISREEILAGLKKKHDEMKPMINSMLSAWESMNEEELKMLMDGQKYEYYYYKAKDRSDVQDRLIVAEPVTPLTDEDDPNDPAFYYFSDVSPLLARDYMIPITLFKHGKKVW